MKSVAQQLWNEPAAFIGLMTSILLAVIAVVTGTDWNAQTILGIVAPVASGLGIRQLVTPVAKEKSNDRGAVASQ